MHLLLKNPIKTSISTISELYVDGKRECHVLEDAVRLQKQWGITAIPAGTFQIALTYSPRFKKVLPLLLNVPGYQGIRIHAGNKAEDTEGCLLPGNYYAAQPNWVSNSKLAFDKLFGKLLAASKKERITLTIQR